MLVIGCLEEEIPVDDQPEVAKRLREVRCRKVIALYYYNIYSVLCRSSTATLCFCRRTSLRCTITASAGRCVSSKHITQTATRISISLLTVFIYPFIMMYFRFCGRCFIITCRRAPQWALCPLTRACGIRTAQPI